MNISRGRWMLECCSRCFRSRANMGSSTSTGSPIDMAYYSYEKLIESDIYSQSHPIVILHGLMGNRTNWQSIAKVLGKAGRKVIAVDARNHGESVHVEDMNYFLFRDDLLRLMDQHDLNQAVLLGHSMGGKIAMTTALTHSERVAGLVIVDIAPTLSPGLKKHPVFLEAMLKFPLMTMADNMKEPLANVRKQVIRELSGLVEDEPMRHFLASNLILKDDKFKWRCNLDSIINNFPEICSFPKFDTEQFTGRSLFVGGSRSDYLLEEHYPLIKKLFPAAEIQHIQDTGHWVHAEKPQLFIKLVTDFLVDAGL